LLHHCSLCSLAEPKDCEQHLLIHLTEIPATGDLWDFGDSPRAFSDLSGTVATDSDGVELLLPSSKATIEDMLGEEIITDPDMTDASGWNVGFGSVSVTDNGDGTITFTETAGEFGGVRRADVPAFVEGALYRHEYSVVAVSGIAELRTTLNPDDFTVSVGDGQVRYVEAYRTSTKHPIVALFPNASVTLSAWSVRKVTAPGAVRQATAGNRPLYMESGGLGFLRFDGSNDLLEALDASEFAAMTGDVTYIGALSTPDATPASAMTLASCGDEDASATTDTAFEYGLDTTGKLTLRRADASATETETASGGALADDTVALLALRSNGNDANFGKDIETVSTSTFATVTSPTAGASPRFTIGSQAHADGGYFEGDLYSLAIIGHALPLGLKLHMQRAMAEHIEILGYPEAT